MALLIDGYNVLHEPRLAGLTEGGLCRLLARAAGPAGSRGAITVVCDGRPKPTGSSSSPVARVDLIFAGKGGSADDLIIRMIDEDSAPRSLIVASTDRVIAKAARRRRAQAWTAAQFATTLRAALAAAGPSDETASAPDPGDGRLPPSEVEKWLKRFGFPSDENAGR